MLRMALGLNCVIASEALQALNKAPGATALADIEYLPNLQSLICQSLQHKIVGFSVKLSTN